MHHRLAAQLSIGIAVIGVCAVISVVQKEAQSEFRRAYETSLAAAGVPIPEGATISTLSLLYVATVSQENPILGLPGNDPDTLEKRIRELADAQKKFADLQKEPREISIAHSLVPIDFLSAMTHAERSRLDFVRTPSSESFRVYTNALRYSVAAGTSDGASFERALARLHPTDVRIFSLGGILSTGRMYDTARQIRTYFAGIADDIRALEACARGFFPACPPIASLDSDMYPEHSSNISEQTKSVIRAWDAASGNTSWKLIQIEHSRCLAKLDGPYDFLVLPDESGARIKSIRYAGDIFLTRLADSTHDVTSYLRDTLGMSYAPVNPVKFYVCPEVRADRGTIRAILETIEFARGHSHIATADRDALLGEHVRERDARAYLEKAYDETRGDERNHIRFLLSLFATGNGDVQELLADVAHTLNNDMRLYSSGVPFNLDASSIILSHNAMPSLYLWDTSSLRDTETRIDEYFTKIEPYSELVSTIDRNLVVRDLRTFLRFEGIVP